MHVHGLMAAGCPYAPGLLSLMATDVAVMGEGTVILGKYTYLTLPPLNATHTWEPLSIN
jgi:hypothetical protein